MTAIEYFVGEADLDTMVKVKKEKDKEKDKEGKLSETVSPIALTKRAQDQLREAMKREQQPKGAGVRVLLVQVANGYRYDLQFESKEEPGDHVSVQGGFKVYIDSTAASALQGYLIDYQMFSGIEWGGFLFEKGKSNLESA